MSDPKTLVAQLKKAANALRKAASWSGTLAPVRSDTDDFVYELVCYFKCALDAKSMYGMKIGGKTHKVSTTKHAALWPRKPGNKVNFSYLSLLNGKKVEVFQLCPGIKIEDKYGKRRAPDINLLINNASSQPTYQELRGCWDAKYVSDAKGRMADTCVSDFVHTFRYLGSPLLPAGWKVGVSQPFKCAGLITNGQFSTEPLGILNADGISETQEFPRSPKTRP